MSSDLMPSGTELKVSQASKETTSQFMIWSSALMQVTGGWLSWTEMLGLSKAKTRLSSRGGQRAASVPCLEAEILWQDAN